MCRVKFFVNEVEEVGLPELAGSLERAGVDFVAFPTTGPSSVWVDGIRSRGATAIHDIAGRLLEEAGAKVRQRSALR